MFVLCSAEVLLSGGLSCCRPCGIGASYTLSHQRHIGRYCCAEKGMTDRCVRRVAAPNTHIDIRVFLSRLSSCRSRRPAFVKTRKTPLHSRRSSKFRGIVGEKNGARKQFIRITQAELVVVYVGQSVLWVFCPLSKHRVVYFSWSRRALRDQGPTMVGLCLA